MMRKISYSAPGKIHLLGEHTVVYGKPALLASIGLRCRVEFIPRKDKKITIVSDSSSSTEVSLTQVLQQTKEANNLYTKFLSNNNTSLLNSITKNEFDLAIIAIGEALLNYNSIPKKGFNLSINSELPFGSGLGSSAALSLSIVACIAHYLKVTFDRGKINDIAYKVEQKKHGYPPGSDNSTSCYGGLIWYRKETDLVKLMNKLTITIPQKISKNFLLIDTGIPEESTGELVSIVRRLYTKRISYVEKILDSQEEQVKKLPEILRHGDGKGLIKVIQKGESNLEKLGVVSSSTKKLIREIEKAGGAAKICGGGGIKKGTGIVLAFHPKVSVIKKIASDCKYEYFNVELGTEGLRKDNHAKSI